jgi:hypothetical protein
MGLQFVNLKGEPIAISPGKPAKKAKGAAPDSYHKGWHVVGFSPQQLAEARHLYEKSPPSDGKPFDEGSFMRTSKPIKVQSAPFVIHESAEVCAELARKQGWKLVQLVAKAKGGK